MRGENEAKLESMQVRQDLEKADFVVNIEKCIWEPSQRVEWLGFYFDLALGELSVPTQKTLALKAKLAETKEVKLIPAKQLASLISKIVSMSLALGSVTRLMTRSLYATLNSRVAWCHKVTLTEEALQEIGFWLTDISNFNGQQIWPKLSAVRVVYSDASSTGYGGTL